MTVVNPGIRKQPPRTKKAGQKVMVYGGAEKELRLIDIRPTLGGCVGDK